MSDYVLLVDSACDLPATYYKEHDVCWLPITFVMEGRDYPDDAGKSMSYKDFYSKMRAQATSTTSMINVDRYAAAFTEYIERGKRVLCLPLSSGISGSYNAAVIAAAEVNERYQQTKVVVCDSLGASLGYGLLIHYLVKKRNNGLSLEALAYWCNENKLNFVHVFTVDDLGHLHRGGRISKTSAVVGGLLGVKPMLDIDAAGTIRMTHKVRGRKAALDNLAEQFELLGGESSPDTVMVSHGDCEEDADYVIAKLKEKHSIKTLIKNYIGPVIGSHAGPGTVALFFCGKKRT